VQYQASAEDSPTQPVGDVAPDIRFCEQPHGSDRRCRDDQAIPRPISSRRSSAGNPANLFLDFDANVGEPSDLPRICGTGLHHSVFAKNCSAIDKIAENLDPSPVLGAIRFEGLGVAARACLKHRP